MKTFRAFLLDAYWADDAIAEGQGFRSGVEKRQKQREAIKKNRRKDKLSAKEKREKKVQDLVSRPSSWRNLR